MIGSRLAGWFGVPLLLALAGCSTSGSSGAPGATVVSSEERGEGSLTRTDTVAFMATAHG